MIKQTLYAVLIFSLSLAATQAGEMHEAVEDAISIFSAKQNSENPIPGAVLKQAKAIGIIEITKGAFGVGGSDGEGVIVVRTEKGWAPPIAFSQGGGSIGFQIGVDIKKLIYVFNTEDAWRNFAGEDKIRFQAAASATAGPDVAAVESANGLPPSNLYVYSLSDGAFAGAAIGGQTVSNSEETNQHAYGTWNINAITSGKIETPSYVHALYDLFNSASK